MHKDAIQADAEQQQPQHRNDGGGRPEKLLRVRSAIRCGKPHVQNDKRDSFSCSCEPRPARPAEGAQILSVPWPVASIGCGVYGAPLPPHASQHVIHVLHHRVHSFFPCEEQCKTKKDGAKPCQQEASIQWRVAALISCESKQHDGDNASQNQQQGEREAPSENAPHDATRKATSGHHSHWIKSLGSGRATHEALHPRQPRDAVQKAGSASRSAGGSRCGLHACTTPSPRVPTTLGFLPSCWLLLRIGLRQSPAELSQLLHGLTFEVQI
mmetsp:Transcript_22964/g.73919  ORF Transcript_22964/g.73919 Transcript_22964/m.73919 type:complete len:269 (+) Transcript_22964:52-858(+)